MWVKRRGGFAEEQRLEQRATAGRRESVAPEEAIEADEATAAFVRERALATVVTNLVPTPFVMLPFVLLIGALMGADLSTTRLSWWLMMAVTSTVLMLVGLYRYHTSSAPGGVTPMTKLIIVAGLVTGGLLFGMCPWVAADSNVEVVLAFTLFPSIAATMGCIVAAGRRDLYVAFLVPITGLSSVTLLMEEEHLLRGLGIISLFFGFTLLMLHHAVSRNALDAIRLQWRSQRLLRDLAHERSELTGVNDQLASINKRLAHQATHDPLTGLYNRRGTLEVLDQLLAGADASRPVGLLFCDLDRFKAVNDALGHRGGDRFISIIADRLLRSLDVGSIAGRMGGDEFVVVMPGHDVAGAAAIASRLVGVLAQPVHAEGRDMPSSVSIGVACAPQHGMVHQPGSCHTQLQQITVPIKVLFVVDMSGSNYMNGSDPGSDPSRTVRGGSIQKFFDDYKAKSNFNWGFVGFQGSSALAFINNGNTSSGRFAPNTNDMTAAITMFEGLIDDSTTPYKAALDMSKAIIQNDTGASANTKYVIVFLSDGMPTDYNSDSQIYNDVSSLIGTLPGRISFNTVYYGAVDASSSNRLKQMSISGGGQFLDTNDNSTGKSFYIADHITIPGVICQ